MSAVPSLAAETGSRRIVPRYPLNTPMDVIILRSGVPDSLPGRCTDLSEAGVGAAVAGDLTQSLQVAIELRLPGMGVPLRARALVRHHTRFRCGLQFVGLSREQWEMVRYWIARAAPPPLASAAAIERVPTPGLHAAARPGGDRHQRRISARRRRFSVLLTFMLALAALGWWQWQRAWHELEPSVSAATEPQTGAPVRVSSEIMERQILYRVNPAYPEAARLANTQGLVVLDAVIGADGAVKRLRAVSGPDVLVQSAMDAVQFWRFEPYRSAGNAIDAETTVAVEFRLN
jgi:TonB family protein